MWDKAPACKLMASHLGFLVLMEGNESLAALAKYLSVLIIASQPSSQSATNVCLEQRSPRAKAAGLMLSQNWLSQLLAIVTLILAVKTQYFTNKKY